MENKVLLFLDRPKNLIKRIERKYPKYPFLQVVVK